MPTDDDVTGLYASDSGDERRNGGLPEKLGSGIVWNEFHMPTEHKNRISERARFLSHRPQGNGKLRGSGDYGMPNSVPNTIDPPYHPKRSRTQSCYIAGSESPHGKPRGAASSAHPQRPIALPVAKLIPLVIDRVQIRTYPRHLSSSLSSPV